MAQAELEDAARTRAQFEKRAAGKNVTPAAFLTKTRWVLDVPKLLGFKEALTRPSDGNSIQSFRSCLAFICFQV